jgi:hypothetical protein
MINMIHYLWTRPSDVQPAELNHLVNIHYCSRIHIHIYIILKYLNLSYIRAPLNLMLNSNFSYQHGHTQSDKPNRTCVLVLQQGFGRASLQVTRRHVRHDAWCGQLLGVNVKISITWCGVSSG